MNRLILVGNGFDLAHGLKTSYQHFIDDFWKSSFAEISRKSNIGKVNLNNGIIEVSNENYINIPTFINKPEIKNYSDFTRELENYFFKHKIINKFFEILMITFSNKNWVDIENEYYNELKKVSDTGYSVDELNKDFEGVKNLLVDYLMKINTNVKPFTNIYNKIYSNLKLNDLENKNKIIDEIIRFCETENLDELVQLQTDFKNQIVSFKENKILKKRFFDEIFDDRDDYSKEFLKSFYTIKDTLVLSFNYTRTSDEYVHSNVKSINIHGKLKNTTNPIIFGFGDDVDKKYQEFEDLNDNRYLENFKSIAYLQTDNYKKLLEFIDSEEYQVFIFGHSCGISDRTMLNTIFEHDNCKSIKPFYHKREDETDNYTEIVQNISRNFNDKKKFRDRVVNKTYCEPLT